LGQVEARVDFCARVDSKNADQYKELGKMVVAGMSEKELKEVRESNDYKTAYDETKGQSEKIPQDKAVEGCRAGLDDESKWGFPRGSVLALARAKNSSPLFVPCQRVNGSNVLGRPCSRSNNAIREFRIKIGRAHV